MEFGIMFFASQVDATSPSKYGLVLEATQYADRHGFRSVWTPERHFHKFGGIFPNPSVMSAALAVLTSRIRIAAGSLVSPLHDEVRVAEDWAVVDNLSGGRVAVSFGSGWNANDFAFFPERYQQRDAIMYDQIEAVQRLWRGEAIIRRNSFGQPVDVRLQPVPVQPALPIWITAAGNPRTFARAGALGANVLTHIIGQSSAELALKIQAYRRTRAENGHDPDAGIVTLMLHTFVGADGRAVVERARPPFREYLRDAVELERRAAKAGGTISQGYRLAPAEPMEPDVIEELLDLACERYFDRGALIGTVESCAATVAHFADLGVDEIACLLDFGVSAADVLDGLPHLTTLQTMCAGLTSCSVPRA